MLQVNIKYKHPKIIKFIVLIYTFFLYKDHTASGRWFIFMNYFVHAFMYSYYSLKALKIQISKWMAMFITVLQILQMIIGVVIGITTYYLKSNGVSCQHKWTNLYFSFLIYFSYFLLFCNFFYHAYLKRNNRYVKLNNMVKNGLNGYKNSSKKEIQDKKSSVLFKSNADLIRKNN